MSGLVSIVAEKGGSNMNRISAETLAALYPLESRRMIRNYASFIEEYPEWVDSGCSLMDYKHTRNRPEFKGWTPPVERPDNGEES